MANKLALAESWRERILAQRASGLSIRGWCREHGVGEYLFYGLRRRLNLSPVVREGHCKKTSPVVLSPGFAEVVARVEPPTGVLRTLARSIELPTSDALRLRLGGSRELLLPATMEIDQVARLIRAIEGIA